MDVKIINNFVDAVMNVMPQLGFSSIKKGGLSVKGSDLEGTGVMVVVGMIGDIKGNIIYSMDYENAKLIASQMMMGLPVSEFDDMAQSAISELSNMLTGNASTNLAKGGSNVDISTPTLIYGSDLKVKARAEKVLCIEMLIDSMKFDLNIAFE